MFRFFKKKYPLLKEEMLTPVDAPISTTDAKRLYKQFMKEIGFLEKDELSDSVSYLAEEIKDTEQYLREECADKKEEIADAKRQLKEFNERIKTADATERDDIEDEIRELKDDLEYYQTELEEAAEALAKFRTDKRTFLVDYINRETHGQ